MLYLVEQYVMIYGPVVLSVLGFIISVVKVLQGFHDKTGEIKRYLDTDRKEVDELHHMLATMAQENAELKKTLNECLTKIDHVKRGD